jgi:acyl carrier protein
MNAQSVPAIAHEVMRIIARNQHVAPDRLRPRTRLEEELHCDPVDVVDIILAVEKRFHVTIPDEVPLTTVGDFVEYVTSHQPALAA